MIGIQLADLDQLFDFGDANFSAGRDHRIKIPRRLAINEIAGLVAFPRFHDRKLRGDAGLEHVIAVVEFFRFLALGQLRCKSGPRVKSGNSGAASAQSFGQRALRN